MKILPNGKTLFEDEFELNYYILTELNYQLTPDGKILDNNTNEILAFSGMIIKGSVNPNQINYAGQGEIELQLLSNVRMITMLFGRFLQQKINEGMPYVSQFTEEMVDDTDIKYSKLTVKHDTFNSTSTEYYHNKCLKFISMIFILDGEDVELRNFDNTIDEET